jgi:hypothetical protein
MARLMRWIHSVQRECGVLAASMRTRPFDGSAKNAPSVAAARHERQAAFACSAFAERDDAAGLRLACKKFDSCFSRDAHGGERRDITGPSHFVFGVRCGDPERSLTTLTYIRIGHDSPIQRPVWARMTPSSGHKLTVRAGRRHAGVMKPPDGRFSGLRPPVLWLLPRNIIAIHS